MTRLGLQTLGELPASIRRPAFDPATLKPGIVHLGIGAFHRAHQGVFTEDAIALRGGDWGIIGASLQRADVPDALATQDCLYTVESLGSAAHYRVIGVERAALFAPRDHAPLLSALTSPSTHVVTLTLSEKGYCLGADGALDCNHPDIAADLATPGTPVSAIGWLALALAARQKAGAAPLTILSCDNLQSNGEKLGRAIAAFAQRAYPGLNLAGMAAFPLTLVDSIVPSATSEHRARVAAAIGLDDSASVQREEFAQWVIEDKFAGPVPAWGAVGAEIVPDIIGYQRLKLHVLNTAHSALAYVGLPRGHIYVRQAIADPELRGFLDAMIEREIRPALSPLDVARYWKIVKARFDNPMIDHRLAQIAEDGSLKLLQRLFPMLVENAQKQRPFANMAAIVRAWLTFMAQTPSRDPANNWFTDWANSGANLGVALDNPAIFPLPFRADAHLRGKVLKSG